MDACPSRTLLGNGQTQLFLRWQAGKDTKSTLILTSLTSGGQCAVKGLMILAGANPARQLSLQPVAPGAVQGGDELD